MYKENTYNAQLTKLLQMDLIEWHVCLKIGQANDPKTNAPMTASSFITIARVPRDLTAVRCITSMVYSNQYVAVWLKTLKP
jgi:hypothetical protein